jgi:Protein of unknown function (DUF2815)
MTENKLNSTFEVRADGRCILKNVVASYPHLDKANAFEGDESKAKFSINALLEIESEAYQQLKKHLASLMPKGAKPAIDRLPFREAKKTPEAWKDVHGVSAYSVKMVNKRKVAVFNSDGSALEPASISGGQIVNVSFEPFWYDNKYGDFCQLTLCAVMLVKEHLKFSAETPASAEDFGVTPRDDFSTVAPRDNKPADKSDPFGDDIPF